MYLIFTDTPVVDVGTKGTDGRDPPKVIRHFSKGDNNLLSSSLAITPPLVAENFKKYKFKQFYLNKNTI